MEFYSVAIRALAGATVADLVSIDALRASYLEGECVLRARAYLYPFAFSGVDQICKNGGFSFRKGGGWVKRMSGEEYEALQVFAGVGSQEAAQRQRIKAETAAAEEKLAAAMERKAEAAAPAGRIAFARTRRTHSAHTSTASFFCT